MIEPIEIIKRGKYVAEIHIDEFQQDPRQDMDMTSILIFESKDQRLSTDDEYDECPLLCILRATNEETASRLEEIIQRRGNRLMDRWYHPDSEDAPKYMDRSREQREFDSWRDELIIRYLDKAGAAYVQFSLAGYEHHRGWAYIPTKELKSFTDVDQARKYIEAEIQVINHWIEGEIYGYVLKRGEDEMESVWGFYGMKHIREAIDEQIEYYTKLDLSNAPTLRVAREFGMIGNDFFTRSYNVLNL